VAERFAINKLSSAWYDGDAKCFSTFAARTRYGILWPRGLARWLGMTIFLRRGTFDGRACARTHRTDSSCRSGLQLNYDIHNRSIVLSLVDFMLSTTLNPFPRNASKKIGLNADARLTQEEYKSSREKSLARRSPLGLEGRRVKIRPDVIRPAGGIHHGGLMRDMTERQSCAGRQCRIAGRGTTGRISRSHIAADAHCLALALICWMHLLLRTTPP